MKKWKLSSTTRLKPTFSCTKREILWSFRIFRIGTKWLRLFKTSSPPLSVFTHIKIPESETKSCSKLYKRNSAIRLQTKKELSATNPKSKSIKKHSSITSTKKRNSSTSMNPIPPKTNSPAHAYPPRKTPFEWNPKFKSANIRVETACAWVPTVKSWVSTVKYRLQKAPLRPKINFR